MEGDGYEEIPMEEREHDDEDEEAGEQETDFGGGARYDRNRGSGARPKTKKVGGRTYERLDSGGAEERETTSGRGLDESIVEFRSERLDEAERRILERYSNWDPTKSKFVATINGKDQVTVSLISGKKIEAKPYVLFNKDGTLRSTVPKTIVKDLGKTTFEIVDWRDTRIDELREQNEELRGVIKKVEKKLRRYNEKKEKIKELVAKSEENEGTINSLKEDLKQLENQKDEDLRRTKEDYETRLEKLEKDNEEMERLKKDDEQNRKTIEKYEKGINEKNEKITDLEKRLQSGTKVLGTL